MTIPGPPDPPLVPGHLGAPSERVCAGLCVLLGIAEVVREAGEAELAARLENKIRDFGVSPEALRDFARHRFASGRWPLADEERDRG